MPRVARCHESGPAGLGRGRWKRAGVSQYLAGGLLHKNLGEALEGCLARHLAAKRATRKHKKQLMHTVLLSLPRDRSDVHLRWSVFNRPTEKNVWLVMSR
jgi:hypothetical protein